ncbi:MAG: hypothetical protein JOY90_26005 [Bradyrhizobium sp.]|uniref:hypothetical protein n=1 Tax=Bradyrhizobium sp. TaxID=376 RepID=UPI001DFE6783|nr:hypothetical protein [Bradyrhizobium sp.]MBV9563868.1 hypothetical protein [Bradyrhizobium sp.]
MAFIGGIAFCLTSGVAQAGPCVQKDAGSGPTVGANAQTSATGTATHAHPPTAAMNSMTKGKATSSEDAQRQEQGQPTAAQQAMGSSSNPSKMGEEQGQASATEQALDTDAQSAKMDQGC